MGKEHQAPEGGERRSAPRVETHGAVGGQLYLDLESDVLLLSSGGMQIRLALAPEVGSIHGFTLTFHNERALDVRGVVRDVQPLGAGPSGAQRFSVGVEFEGLDPSEREFIDGFVAKLRS